MTAEDRTALANLLKSRGNTLFSKKDFASAIDFYTRAIAVSPVESAVFYSNRAACEYPIRFASIGRAGKEKGGRELVSLSSFRFPSFPSLAFPSFPTPFELSRAS